MDVSGQQGAVQNIQYDGGFYREIDGIFLQGYQQTQPIEQPMRIDPVEESIHNDSFPAAMEVVSQPVLEEKNKSLISVEKRPKKKKKTDGFCGVCLKQYACIAQHKKTHTVREKKHKCQFCDKAFLTKQGLEYHMETHSQNKSIQCEKCEKRFASKGSLQNHMARKHDEHIYVCPVCGKVFNSKIYFQRHKKIHSAERKYQCDTCGMRFAWSSILRDHKLIHTGEKPHKCHLCGKSYRQRNAVRSHIENVHEKKTRFMCEKCGYRTNQREGIKRHMKRHGIGLKFLPCHICHKTFGYSSTLRVHMTTHTKKHKCDVCGERFSQAKLLTNHIAKYAGEKPFKCGHCGKCFHKRADSKHHVIMRHVLGKEEPEKGENLPIKILKPPTQRIRIEIIPKEEEEHCDDADEEKMYPNCFSQISGGDVSVDKVLEARLEISKNWNSNLLKVSDVPGLSLQPTEKEVLTHSNISDPGVSEEEEEDVQDEADSCDIQCLPENNDGLQLKDSLPPATIPEFLPSEIDAFASKRLTNDGHELNNNIQSSGNMVGSLEIPSFPDLRNSKHLGYNVPLKIESHISTEIVNSGPSSLSSVGLVAGGDLGVGCVSPFDRKGEGNVPIPQALTIVLQKAGFGRVETVNAYTSSYNHQEEKIHLNQCIFTPIQQPSLQAVAVLPTMACGASTSSVPIFSQAVAAIKPDETGSSKRKKNAMQSQICDTCGKSVKNMYQHMFIHAVNENLPCDVCGKRYRNSKCLSMHMKLHTNKMPHQCSKCPRKFLTRLQLNDHMCTHTGDRPHVCDKCGRTFIRERSLSQHMRIHANYRPFVCKFCNKAFTQKCILVDHLRIHTGERPYVCDICGAAFRQSSSRRSHRFMHIAEKSIKCDQCDYVTARKEDLKKHYRVHGELSDRKTFKCHLCENTFTAKHTLNRHLKLHQKLFLCALCGLRFKTRRKYEEHLKRLADAPVMSCGVCQKTFHGMTSMNRHMAVHTGRQKVDSICGLCNHNFHSEFALNNHIRRYAGMKPIVCGHCGKKFHKKHFARKHVMSHVTEKKA